VSPEAVRASSQADPNEVSKMLSYNKAVKDIVLSKSEPSYSQSRISFRRAG
jgi:hypothetical protein